MGLVVRIEEQCFMTRHRMLLLLFMYIAATRTAMLESHLECTGLRCYNGGTYEYQDDFCVCRCPPGFSGLLCDFQLYDSAWPVGPYALLMPKTGCPEPTNRGWNIGYIDFVTLSAFTTWRHASDVTHGEYNITEIVVAEEGTNVKGPIKKYFFRLNFCFKQAQLNVINDTKWPRGEYSIFGATEGCPKGFLEELHPYSLPPVQSWSSDGYLPYLHVNISDNSMLIRRCRRSEGGQTAFPDDWSTFVFMKSHDEECAGRDHGFYVIDETLVFATPLGVFDDVDNRGYISYCHYWNPDKGYLFACAEEEFDCGRGQCIAASSVCDGVVTCPGGIDEKDESCAFKCSELEFYCGNNQCISKASLCDYVDDCPDARDEVPENCADKCFGRYFVCDHGYCQGLYYLCDGYPDCEDETDEDFANCLTYNQFYCAEENYFCAEDSCHNKPSCNTSMACTDDTGEQPLCPDDYFPCDDGDCIGTGLICDGFMDCKTGEDELNVNCHLRCRSWEYYCAEEMCETESELCDRIQGCTDTANNQPLANQDARLICQDDLGMTDGIIKDFQISATSWSPLHQPHNVRPTLNSWCPDLSDLDPFLQVDLYAPAIIGGLVLYNKVGVEGLTVDNWYRETNVPYGVRQFSISYAIFPRAFRLYSKRPFVIDLSRNFSVPQQFTFLRPFLARYIRVHPETAIPNGVLCSRLTLTGCRNPGQLKDECGLDSDSFWVRYSVLQPVSTPMRLNFSSTTDCLAACEQELDTDCSAARYTEDAACDVYPRSASGIQYANRGDVTSTAIHLLVCWDHTEAGYIQARRDSTVQFVNPSVPGTTSSQGYPFSYPAANTLIWVFTSTKHKYTRVTFIDIDLDISESECDFIAVRYFMDLNDPLDHTYNGRVVTVPVNTPSVTVRFVTCARYAGTAGMRRGFRLIYKEEDTPTVPKGIILEQHVRLAAFPVLGLIKENRQRWIFEKYMYIETTFHYFHIPCNEEFSFRINLSPYCNTNRPRMKYRGWVYDFDFIFTGKVFDYMPEGFSLTIVELEYDFVHERLLSTPENAVNLPIGDKTFNTTQVCSRELGKCYMNFLPSRHSDTDSRGSWATASDTCHGRGYTLLNFHRRQEEEFIVSWMTHVFDIVYGHLRQSAFDTYRLYLGLTRYMGSMNQEHIWENGARVSYLNWGSGEPRNILFNLCTEMVISQLQNGSHWQTVACDDVPTKKEGYYFGTVCEKPLTGPPTAASTLVRGDVPYLEEPVTDLSMLFPCQGGEWVHSLAVCDGVPDCLDASDELDCDVRNQGACTEDTFRCTDGTCIQLDLVCNHVIDCSPDGNDEFCALPPCKEGQFQCDSSQCVPAHARCDSVSDCLDQSDEIGCVSCNSSNSFLCGDLTCVHESRVCDRISDCRDGRDEQDCDPAFSTCHALWLAGIGDNITLRGPWQGMYIKADITFECQFHVTDDSTLGVTTLLELDTTWFPDPLPKIEVLTSNLRQHGNVCIQKYTHTCLENILQLAKVYDPFMNDSYSYCAETTTTVTVTFGSSSDDCDVINIQISDDGEERFFIYRYCDYYAISSKDTLSTENYQQNVTIGPVICEAEYELTDEIQCGGGRQVPESHRCLYDIGRAGNVEGCPDYRHLQKCESFDCPADYVKCPNAFCLAKMFVCDGVRQCPGGQDEQNCGCSDRNVSLVVVYHGSADERMRSYIYKFARQFYSNTSHLHTVRFTKLLDSEDYQLIKRPVHPFSEALNKDAQEVVESNGSDIVNVTASMYENGTSGRQISVVYIDDDSTTRRLSSTQTADNPNIARLYRVTLDRDMAIVSMVTERSDKETDIAVNQWKVLESTGEVLFPSICPGSQFSDSSIGGCVGQYKCSSSKICIPVKQICDGKNHCPFADDEEMCDFRCLATCSCHRYIADCSWSNFSHADIAKLSDTTRKLDISNNEITVNGVFIIPKPFPQLLRLNASSCDIRLIKEYTFENAMHLLYLDLSYNRLRTVQRHTFDGLAKLRELKLEGNVYIESIEQYSFTAFTSLTELVIQNSEIREILPDTFAGLAVDILDISNNKISKVHGFAVNDLSVVDLRIDGNILNDFDANIFAGVRNLKHLRTPAFKFCCFKPTALPEDNCLPEKDEFSSCEDLMRNSALQTLLWILGIAALIGNTCTIVYRVVYDRERLKIGFGMFVTNLAASDLLMGVYMITIAIADLAFRNRYIMMEDYWRSSGWCTFAGILATVSSETSVLFLCLITIDRLLVVKFPFGEFRFDTRKASLMAVFSWVFSLVVAIIPVLATQYFQDRFYSTTGVCIALPLTSRRPPGWLYSFLIFICLNLLTFVLIALGQVMIYREIRHNSKKMRKVSSKRRDDLKIARNLFLVLMTDFLCWFPIGVMGILALQGTEIPGDVYAWTAVLIMPINSALNPFLYTLAAILGKKQFNPRIDEQIQPSIKAVGGMFVKLFNSDVIIPTVTTDYTPLADMLLGNSVMTTRQILAISMSLVHGLCGLHDSGLFHGNLDPKSVLIHRKVAGKASFLVHPKMVRTKGAKGKDIGDIGHVIRHMLRYTKTASTPHY